MYEIKYNNTYDEEGRLICKKTKGFDIMAMVRFYEYDDNGNVMHETIWSPYLQEIVSETAIPTMNRAEKLQKKATAETAESQWTFGTHMCISHDGSEIPLTL
ncbi:MAG: hypothetical protein IJ906_09905 [Oscillospiraceae bacterium]|nr:hypothetical protein [Oscillospiraceae bacterium]